MSGIKSYTLTELLSMVKEAVRLGVPGTYWVVAEIAEARVDQKGHCYLTLVEKQQEKISAQIRANIWAYVCRRLMEKFTAQTGERLKSGLKVMLIVSVEFHESFGMSLNIRDIEPSYTLGDMALKKRETIERLTREGLLDKNKSLPMPTAPQRIAVVSSPHAAGYGDFLDQLMNNQFGYKFVSRLFPAVMQGEEAEASVAAALDSIGQLSGEFDLVALIRGGGSTLDLSCFDTYGIASAIALCPLPVITGIGHERDDTVADMAAHTSLKTPTAVAEFLISGLREIEDFIIDLHYRLCRDTERLINQEQQRLRSLSERFISVARGFTVKERNRLHLISLGISGAVRIFMNRMNSTLTNLEQAVRLLSPDSVLSRGYSITTCGGRSIKDIGALRDGSVILTTLASGSFESVYKQKRGAKKIEHRKGDDLFSGIR